MSSLRAKAWLGLGGRRGIWLRASPTGSLSKTSPIRALGTKVFFIMGHPALQKDTRFVYRDYLSWPEGERYELIDGVAFAMSPAPLLEHQGIVGAIHYQLFAQLEGKPCRAFVAPVDVRLPSEEQDDDHTDTVVQPDVFVVCDERKFDPRGVRGAPDFVVEVLSPRTAARDHLEKKRAYERAGVREYWLVHPTDRLLTLYRQSESGFAGPAILPLEGSTAVGVLPGVSVSWEPVIRLLEALPRLDPGL